MELIDKLESIVYKGKGYLINHRYGLASYYNKDISQVIKEEMLECYSKHELTDLMKLILHEDTIYTEENIKYYYKVATGTIDNVYIPYEDITCNKDISKRIKEELSINEVIEEKIDKRIKIGEHRYITPNYRTEEDIYTVANNYGCYAIYNETLQTIYVGETIVNFHQRWNSHYTNKNISKKKRDFLNHPDTYCMILYISNGDKQETEEIEAQCIKYYKQEYSTWTILGGTYKDNCRKYY